MGGGSDAVQKLSSKENTALGIAAGIIEVTILQPMLYCKNATQQKLPFTLNPRILYRGLAMSVTNMAILTGLQFPLTGLVTKFMTGGAQRRLTSLEQIGSGFIGGCLSGFACAPMELVMIQQQRFGGTLLATPLRIVGEVGASTLFRGLLMSCGREGMFTAGYLGIGPSITRTLQEDHKQSVSMAKAGGAVGGGVIAATLSHPMDTCKTCMQGDIQQQTYKSLRHTAAALYAEAGPSRFFRGWAWRTGRMICAVFIMNECKVQLAPLMFPQHFRT